MADIVTGLVAHWKCNDNAADTTVVDNVSGLNGVSQHGNTSTMTTGGVINSALYFDGSNDYLVVNSNPLLTFTDGVNDIAFSICFWFYRISASTTLRAICKGGTYGTTGLEWFTYGDPQIRIFTNGSGAFIGRVATAGTLINEWHHITYTYDGSKNKNGIKIYVDAVRRDNADANNGTYTGIVDLSQNLGIAAGNNGNTKTGGTFDDIRIYRNRVLGESDIRKIFNSGRGTEGEDIDEAKAMGIGAKLAVIP